MVTYPEKGRRIINNKYKQKKEKIKAKERPGKHGMSRRTKSPVKCNIKMQVTGALWFELSENGGQGVPRNRTSQYRR
jgi:hypothetical protein